MTSVRWITSVQELEAEAPLIRRLAATAGRDLPAADPDFLRSYIANFEYGPPPVPEIIVAERNGQPIGFLATRMGRRDVLGRFGAAERTLLVTHDHDRVNLVAAPADATEAATAIARAIAPALRRPALEISGLVPGDPLHRALHEVGGRSPSLTTFDHDLPPFCSVAVRYGHVDEYFRALAKTMRSNVSRQARRLFAAGAVGLLALHGPTEVRRFLPAYFDLEQRSWKFAGQAGILRSAQRTTFFVELASGHAAYVPSAIGITLNGVLVAGLILGRFGDSMWALEMAFDEDHADLGSGQLLLVLAMREAIAAGAMSIGYLQHFAYFKTRWLAEETAVVSTRIVRVGSPLHLRHIGAQRKRGDQPGSPGLAGRNEALPVVDGTPRRADDALASAELLLRSVDPASVATGPDAADLLPFSVR